MDILIASILLLFVAPLLLPVAVAIVCDSPGSVFYRRRVIGRYGRPFDALKFRTMVEDNERQLDSNKQLAEEFGKNHKLRNDPRVTRVGRILRKYSIDEIPQLINVLLGQMSLVGPRIISFPEIEKFGQWLDIVLTVKPGITGLWQVNGRGDLPYEERVRLNVYYVQNRSLLLDIKILLKTIPAVLSGRGAY
jgi:lipopolysaccharide/colanic/teichoic acid biosynthesis glycosyltransferase